MGDVQNNSSSGAFTNRSLSAHPELSTCPFIALFSWANYPTKVNVYTNAVRQVCQFHFSDFGISESISRNIVKNPNLPVRALYGVL